MLDILLVIIILISSSLNVLQYLNKPEVKVPKLFNKKAQIINITNPLDEIEL